MHCTNVKSYLPLREALPSQPNCKFELKLIWSFLRSKKTRLTQLGTPQCATLWDVYVIFTAVAHICIDTDKFYGISFKGEWCTTFSMREGVKRVILFRTNSPKLWVCDIWTSKSFRAQRQSLDVIQGIGSVFFSLGNLPKGGRVSHNPEWFEI